MTGQTRAAVIEHCERCGRTNWYGLNAGFGGWRVGADPQPLTIWGEALALIGGRGTVSLHWLGNRYEIDSRDSFRIRGSPAGTSNMDVLVIHDCGRDYGGGVPHMASTLRRLWAIPIDSDIPPY